jgi:large subunit ribosomal protein L13
MTLGRLSTVVAERLRGKHKPYFTPFLDTGDHVIVTNASKVVMTGGKADAKYYRKHSGYPGGLKETPATAVLEKYPERIVEHAVKGMLPKGKLGRKMFRKLKVYSGPDHPHVAQQPKALAIADAIRGR